MYEYVTSTISFLVTHIPLSLLPFITPFRLFSYISRFLHTPSQLLASSCIPSCARLFHFLSLILLFSFPPVVMFPGSDTQDKGGPLSLPSAVSGAADITLLSPHDAARPVVLISPSVHRDHQLGWFASLVITSFVVGKVSPHLCCLRVGHSAVCVT